MRPATLLAFLIFLLVLLNIGGLVSLVLDLGRGQWAGLWKLGAVVGLDVLGFWLVRRLRQE